MTRRTGLTRRMKNFNVGFILVCCIILFLKEYSATPLNYRYYSFDSRCEPLTIDMCKGLPYNETHLPNLMNHDTQREANAELSQFSSLIKVNCSEDLRDFLCYLYAPVCTALRKPIPPCRTLCKRVRRGCIKLLRNFGFKWPKKLRCKKFPKPKRGVLCVDKKSGGQKPAEGKKKKRGSRKSKKKKKNRKGKKGNKGRKGRKKKRGNKKNKKGNKGKNQRDLEPKN